MTKKELLEANQDAPDDMEILFVDYDGDPILIDAAEVKPILHGEEGDPFSYSKEYIVLQE